MAALTEHYESTPPLEPVRRRLYVDTFDRRLAAAGTTLHFARTARGWRVVWNSAVQGPLRATTVANPPDFATDLPPGPFRSALASVIEMRRVLPVAEARGRGTGLGLRDGRGKTVAQVAVERWTLPGKRRGPLALRVISIRGYEKAFRKVVALLRDELNLGRPAAAHPLAALGFVDAAPTKSEFQLESGMRTDEALKFILRGLLESVRANEEGTKLALDTEFLHEFRVAVRRTRAALSRFKGVFTARTLARFAREFRWLGTITGPLRDLDVYLLKFDDYLEGGNAAQSLALEPVRAHLLRRQEQEQTTLRRHLASARFRRLVAGWDAFLQQPVAVRTTLPNARRPIDEFAREQIWKFHRRVLKHGRAIDTRTPADAVHELRLDCKKLRYMMEFCRSLFDKKTMAAQVKALKRLQDNLGDFNDLEVQQLKLQSFAGEMEARGEAPLETALAMGQLIEQLKERQDEERRRFERRFPEFDSAANNKRARRLFRPRPESEKK
jgi:CHAD domain-containing protein